MPALVAAVRVELEGEDCVVTMIRDLIGGQAMRRVRSTENEAAQRAIFDLSPDAISVARRIRRPICGSQRGISTAGQSPPRTNHRQVGPRTRGLGQAVGPRNIHRHPCRARVRYATSRSIFCAATEPSSRP